MRCLPDRCSFYLQGCNSILVLRLLLCQAIQGPDKSENGIIQCQFRPLQVPDGRLSADVGGQPADSGLGAAPSKGAGARNPGQNYPYITAPRSKKRG